MDYYHGQALVMGESTEIRVKPENIQGDFVSEIELYLPTHQAVPKSPGSHMVNAKATWGWHTKRRIQDSPTVCMDIWVEIGGIRKSLKFRGS